ncbi:MAG: glycosyltransferase family 25 protein, partial [Thermomicrobiales bacterium]
MDLNKQVLDAFHAGDFPSGRLACDRLRCAQTAWPEVLAQTRRNQLFYVEQLEEMLTGVMRRLVALPGEAERNGLPVVAVSSGSVVVAVPAAIEGRRTVLFREAALNQTLDADWEDPGVDAASLLLAASDANLAGFQFVTDGVETFAVTMSRDAPGGLHLDLRSFDLTAMTAGEMVESGSLPDAWTTNSPIAWQNGGLIALTSLGPTVALRLTGAVGPIEQIARHDGPRLAEDLRGGTALVPFGDEFLAVVREYASYPGGAPLDVPAETLYPDGLSVLHRFITFDRTWRITRFSHPFVFNRDHREACGGLALSDGQVVMAWDLGHRETWLTTVPAAEVERSLRPIAQFMPTGTYAWLDEALAPSGDLDHRDMVTPRRDGTPVSGMPQTWREVLDAPAFVINLDRSAERLRPVTDRIAVAGFTDIRRVRAVDGTDSEALAAAWAALGNPPLAYGDHSFRHRTGHQGCFLSHVQLWQRMIEEGIESATIFEDDVMFHDDWTEMAENRWAATPAGTHVVWFGASPGKSPNADGGGAVAAIPVFGAWSYWLDRRGA